MYYSRSVSVRQAIIAQRIGRPDSPHDMRLYLLILIALAISGAVRATGGTHAGHGSPRDTVVVSSVEVVPSLGQNTSEPSLFSLRTAIYASGAAVVTAGLMHSDQRTYATIHQWKEQSATLHSLSPEITTLGTGSFSVGLFGGYFGYGMLFDDARARQVGRIGVESFVLSGAAVQIMKIAFGRERPSVASQPGGKWNGPLSYFRGRPHPNGIASFDSFPSGHTATAFAAATTLSDLYDDPWVSYVSYSIATGVGISRIMESTHWMSDCFVGGLIGFLSTRVVEKLNALPASVSVGPSDLQRSYAVRITVGM